MDEPTLTITHGRETRTAAMAPKGMVLGRSSACDVVLDHPRVSRQHARLFRDPFRRWIVEDMGSRNGVWIAHRRAQAGALLAEERFEIGPFVLWVSTGERRDIAADPDMRVSTVLQDDPTTELQAPTTEPRALDGGQVKRLNVLSEQIAALTSPAELYPSACRLAADAPRAVAAVVRVPAGGGGTRPAPHILACCFTDERRGALAAEPGNLHLSRRVLDAICQGRRPVAASNLAMPDADLTLTVGDAQRPRVVLCAPVSEGAESLDALYLDVPASAAARVSLDYVQAVARQVGLARRSLLLAEANAERRSLDHQLAMARDIQARLVPAGTRQIAGLDVSVVYEPAMWVGGDYCDVWALGQGRAAFAVGDVCGKGLPAAMLMTSLHAALRTASSFCAGAAGILDHVNRLLSAELPDGRFVTLFLGLLEPASGRLEYASAGHVPPILVAPPSARPLLPPRNAPIGVHGDTFAADATTIEPGTAVVLVTDGVTEAAGPGGETFGSARLEALLASAADAAPEAIVRKLLSSVAEFRQSLPPGDDVTVMALRRAAGGAAAAEA